MYVFTFRPFVTASFYYYIAVVDIEQNILVENIETLIQRSSALLVVISGSIFLIIGLQTSIPVSGCPILCSVLL
jgi:hypothetical protein